MRAVKLLNFWIVVITLLALVGAGRGFAAPLTQDAVWNVTSPNEGTVVSGEVTIQGTASHPNFGSYGVLYAPGPRPTADSQWVPITFGVSNMVINGPLTTWDTTQIPNGQYTLALAVYEVGNDTPNLHFVNNITVQNEEATPTPEPTATPLPEPTQPTEGEGGEDAGPIIAPTIEQPPTATPRATATLEAGTPAEGEGDGEEEGGGFLEATALSMDAVRDAFCSGAWLAVLIYLIGGLYVAGRAAWRYYQRQQSRGAPRA